MSSVIATSESQTPAAVVLPISLEWAKLHIKALVDTEDDLIESWIQSAVQTFEMTTGHQIMRAQWSWYLDGFPAGSNRIELPHPPLVSVEAVEYLSDGSYVSFGDGGSPEVVSWSSRTMTGVPARRGWIEPASGFYWPTLTAAPGLVRVRYTAGYATTEDDVPAVIKTILAMLLASFEQFRSEVHLSDRSSKLEKLPFGAEQLMRPFIWSAASRQQFLTGGL